MLHLSASYLSALRLALAGIALVLLVDNGVAAPVNVGPIERPFDLSLRPMTKPFAPPVAMPETDAGLKFLLRRVELVGMTAMSAADLLGHSDALIGREVSLGELYSAANAITPRMHP